MCAGTWVSAAPQKRSGPSAQPEGQAADASTLLELPREISFRRHIIPILAKYGCSSGACHGALAGKNGFKLSLRGWDPEFDYDALTRDASGRRIVKSDPAQSLFLRKPTAQIKHGGGERFKQGSYEYNIFYQWIASGIPAPQKSDARVESLRISPHTALLEPEKQQAIAVQAIYTDGSIDDVTRWARYSTTDEGVATVGDDGIAKGAGPGEAVINVWYASKVGMMRVGSPFPRTVDPKLFAASPRNNFIDEHVLGKLKTLNIPPSGETTDAEFIRRAYLDAAGILPTPKEIEAFIADATPDKRVKLVDKLLAREELTDYWAYQFSDVLLLSSKKLKDRPGLLSFYRFVRASIARNEPWNQFVRDIITASGSNLENGAVNFFAIHKETADLSETTSQAFLGLSIGCAKCHNHPLEKWTLDDYYGMANLVSRVKLKNGDRTGEILLQSATAGNIPHPVTGEPMPPKPLDGQPMAVDSTRDRRQHLADWLTAPENPYFARAIVNRVWKNFMGRGLAEPEDDMRLTNPVSNEALMSALAKDFIDHKFDLRHLMKMIMTSAAYQRSSLAISGNETDEKYYSHYIVRRLPAEVILDAYSTVTDVSTNFPGYPMGWRAMQLPDSQVASYFLDAFGRPDRTTTCSCERTEATTMTQALHVSNGSTLNDKLRAKGGTIDHLVTEKTPDDAIINEIYATALGRKANATEIAAAADLLKTPTANTDPAKDRREKIEDVVWAVVTSKEFLFNH